MIDGAFLPCADAIKPQSKSPKLKIVFDRNGRNAVVRSQSIFMQAF
jgi:hypothetical protein